MIFFSYQLGFLSALIFLAIIHIWGRWIHRHATVLLWTVLVISISTIFIQIPFISFYIKSGHGSLGLFMLIIIAGILPKKSIYYKDILLVRGHLAIMGFLLLIPHGLERIALALAGYQTSGLIAAVIMIPLVMTSFMFVRKRMKPIHWKRLHWLSYIVYVMIYLHLGFTIYISSGSSFFVINQNAILYHIFAMIYIFFKIRKIILRLNKKV